MKVESLKDELMDQLGFSLRDPLWVSLRDPLRVSLRYPLWDPLWDTIDRQAGGDDEG
jgi:hypothetical protein